MNFKKLHLAMQRRVWLNNAVDVARHSYLVHRSVSYLDLSTCELTDLVKVTYTEEGFQKKNIRSSILYKYHLDILNPLELRLKGVHRFRSSLTKYTWEPNMPDLEEVYYRDLLKDISRVVFSSTNRLSEMRRYWPTMKKMKLCQRFMEEPFYRSYLLILLAECEDSEFVIDFVETRELRINFCLMKTADIEIVNYVLHHAQKMKLELYDNLNPNSEFCCPVSHSFFLGNVKCAISFLKYGKLRYPTRTCEVRNYVLCPTRFRRSFVVNSLRRSVLSLQRIWLLLQLVYAFTFNIFVKEPDYLQALVLIWRSIPEPFLTRHEVEAASKWCPYQGFSRKYLSPMIFKFYRDSVLCGEECGDVGPRSLRHLSRCAARKRLAENFAVPDGIDDLPLPTVIRDFLRMDY